MNLESEGYMKLKKALEIISYYAYLIHQDKFIKLAEIKDDELEELEDAYIEVKEFLNQFK